MTTQGSLNVIQKEDIVNKITPNFLLHKITPNFLLHIIKCDSKTFLYNV